MSARSGLETIITLVSAVAEGVRFFSRLPVPYLPHRAPALERMAPPLALAGLAIGFFPALGLYLFAVAGAPPLMAGFVAVGIWALVTGAMQEDALADSFDGLWGGKSPEQRLEIFKDSRIGAYGVLAIVVATGLRASALGYLVERDPLAGAAIWLGVGILARSGALWLAVALPAARETGAGAVAGRLSKRAFFVSAGLAMVISGPLIATFIGIWALVGGVACLIAAQAMWTRICAKLVGGQSGDLIGGGQAVLEIVALCAFIVLMGA